MNRIAVWIFLAFSALYVAATRGHFVGTDEVTVYQTTRSIWENGNLATNPTLPNSLRARRGGAVGVYDPGQSVAALPLYALGRAVDRLLTRAGADDWIETFAGGVLEYGGPDYRWAGDVEIFFVDLYNAFATALLVSLFFLFSVELGATAAGALAASVLLGLTTYVVPFAAGFLQHSSEALLLLASFYFLHRDAKEPSWRLRALAGAAFTALILIRPQAGIAFPAVALYGAGVILRRRRSDAGAGTSGTGTSGLAGEIAPGAVPLAAGLAVHFAVNHAKFGTWNLAGGYADQRFGPPSLKAAYGFLLSPGDGIFFFTPLLVLLPFTLPLFFRRHRREALAAMFLSFSYLAFYSCFLLWHGLWSAPGPRYLMPVVPVLLLPLAEWIDAAGRRAWLALAPLALTGFFVQAVNVATNFAYVYNREGYLKFRPEYGFLFIPRLSPIAASTRAFFSGGPMIDMWLVAVERRFGLGRLLVIAGPLAAFIALCLWRLRQALRSEREASASRRHGTAGRVLAAIAVLAILATGAGLLGASKRWPSKERDARVEARMKAGLDLFYTQRRPAEAAAEFREVLELDPNHYGATFQLAFSLETAGRREESRREWKRVIDMARRYHDRGTEENARRHYEDLK